VHAHRAGKPFPSGHVKITHHISSALYHILCGKDVLCF
jgi:hypothetical protein